MFEQLRELRNRWGFEVTAVISGNRGSLVDKLKQEKIPFYSCDFSFSSLQDIWALPKKILSLARLFRRERFDVVQTHLFHSMIIGRIAAWLADVPLRFSMITGPFHLEAHTPRWIDLSTCWMDTKIIASCEYTRTLYKRFGLKDKRIVVIYYGADANRFDPARTTPASIRQEFGWPAETPIIAMVAYFYPRLVRRRWVPPMLWNRATKGHEYLIRAMSLVLAEFSEAKCLLVGSGWEGGQQYMSEMKELVRSLHLEQSVVFTGFRSDINNILRAIDVSVQPSLNENLGGTIESLLMECPTVATRVGGMTDSVRDGETGVLVEPANAEDLATGILKLLRNPELAHNLACQGRSFMLAHFTLERTVENLKDLYESEYAQKKMNRVGYRLYSSFWRFLIALPFAIYLTLRLLLIDLLWFKYGDRFFARARGRV
jgi:glycosyltransferase involved in cell wall biosynthesis